jgi:tetratricopeptide (TPR) repeat protein
MAFATDDVDQLLLEVAHHTKAKDFQVALRYCREANSIAPDRADVWAKLGQLYLDLGNVQAGYDAANQAVQLDPLIAEGYYIRAWARGSLGDFDGEIADAQIAYRLQPNSPETYYRRLARAYAGKEDFQYALTCCHLVLAFDPNDTQALVNRSGLYRLLTRYSEASLDLERAITLSPHWYVPHYALGLVQLDAKQYREAVQSFSKALETDPDSQWYPRILAFRGHAYELAGYPAEAERDTLRARQLNPNVWLYGSRPT